MALSAPIANLPTGLTVDIPARAGFANGLVDVTQQASYVARSGGTNVFSIGADGAITTNGNGFDWLDVSYGGQTASAVIRVGSCSYVLEPSNQFIAQGGGNASIQVATKSGCSWTADSGGVSWLSLSNASATGNGSISASVTANITGSIRTAFISLNGQDVAIVQPATNCTYTVGTSQVQAPAAGTSGSISATSSCPLVVGASQPWIATTTLSTSVAYVIGANTSGTGRTGSITIGDQVVKVSQDAAPVPSVTTAPTSVAFASQPVGTNSAAQAVTITNTGTAALALSSIAASGDFTQTNNCGSNVSVGDSCTAMVVFAPTASGSRVGTLTINDNASNSPQTVSLTGTGVAVSVSSTPNTLSIPSSGGSAYATIQLSPQGGFTGTLNLACSITYQGQGTPNDAPKCSFSPGQAQITGNSVVSSTLTLTTTAASMALSTRESNRSLLVIVGLVAFFLKRRWRLQRTVIVSLLVLAICGLIGCPSNPNHTQPTRDPGTSTGAYQVVVTASNAQLSATTSLSLSVQ